MDSQKQSVKALTKSKKGKKKAKSASTPKPDPELEQRRQRLYQVQYEATLGALLLKMFSQLETDAMNELRGQIAAYRMILTEGVATKFGTQPQPYMDNLPEAVARSWNSFRNGKGNTFQTFYEVLITPPEITEEPTKQKDNENDETKPADVVEVLEFDQCDSPSLYRLANDEDYLSAMVEIKQELCSPTTSVPPELSQ